MNLSSRSSRFSALLFTLCSLATACLAQTNPEDSPAPSDAPDATATVPPAPAPVFHIPPSTGGSVQEGAARGWRWHSIYAPAGVELSGAEKKTATDTAGGAFATVRGTSGIYAPVHQKAYFEIQPIAVGMPATFAVGLCNASLSNSAALGSTNHGFGYYADGTLKVNNVALAQLPPYHAGDVIGMAVDLSKWDPQDVLTNPGHVIDWRMHRLWITKNGQPVSDKAGIDISMIPDALYATACFHEKGDAATVHSAAGEFTGKPGEGFAAWGGVQQLVVTGDAARYIRPGATGDGTSWEKAAPLEALDAAIAAVQAGGTKNPHVFIRAEEGIYPIKGTISISHGGVSPENPVVITGVSEDLTPLQYVTEGTRQAWVLPNDPEEVTPKTNKFGGNNLYSLQTGANNLVFRQLRATRLQCSIYNAQRSEHVTVEDCEFYNCRRGIVEGVSGKGLAGKSDDLSCFDWIVRRINGTGHSKPAVDFRAESKRILVEDCHFNSGIQAGDEWSVGVKFNDNAGDSIIRRVYSLNMKEIVGHFAQGDAFEVNNGNKNVSIENCVAYRARDGAFDSKSDGGAVRNCLADSCTRVKLWGDEMNVENLFVYNTGMITHHGQDKDKSWITWKNVRLYDRPAPPPPVPKNATTQAATPTPVPAGPVPLVPAHIFYEKPHTISRFVDCFRVATGENYRLIPFGDPSIPSETSENRGTCRPLFGTASDKTPPKITGAADAIKVAAGQPLLIPLTANEPVTWGIKGGKFVCETGTDRCVDTAFQIDKYATQDNSLKFLGNAPAAFDAAAPVNNRRTVIVQARDANNNVTEKQFTVMVTER